MCCWITRDPTFGDQPLLCPCLLSLPFNIKVYPNDERCPQVTDVLTEASARESRSTGSKSIVASFTGGTRTGQSLLLLIFSCCAVPLARKSCNSLRCEPLTAGLSLPFEHKPVGINVSPYVSCLQLFFCWRLLGLIPDGAPFSQLSSGVKDAMVVCTRLKNIIFDKNMQGRLKQHTKAKR